MHRHIWQWFQSEGGIDVTAELAQLDKAYDDMLSQHPWHVMGLFPNEIVRQKMLSRKRDIETELKAIDKKLTQLCRDNPWYKLSVLTGQLQILINELEQDRLKAERENQSRPLET